MMVLFATDANYEATLDLLAKLRAESATDAAYDCLTDATIYLIAQWREFQEAK